MEKHEKFEEMRFQAKRKYILKSLDSKSKMMEKILFHKKRVNLSMVDESNIIIFQTTNMTRDTIGLWMDGKTLRVSFVELTYFTTLHTFKVSVTMSAVKNMGFAKEEAC